ncbi:MAG: isochorismatase family protein [Bacteroidales bacterium]|nr:isochorismatase family protein [Bacteroidales bacterium]
MKNCAIVVVDVLYDFIDGGALACAHSTEAAEATAEFIRKHEGVPVLFVCDHHPSGHCSFKQQGGPWPPHCVEGTHGAEIHELLQPFVNEDLVFLKGCNEGVEQYSGFEGRNAAGQTLGEVLEIMETELVYVTGIATEYCVRNTAEDLLNAGFKVSIPEDCLGWVDATGHASALEALASARAVIRSASQPFHVELPQTAFSENV